LRIATRADHERVDALFGHFRLDDEASYRLFLKAHASAIAALEPAAQPDAARLPLLRADLDALGETMPAALPLAPPADEAMRWGMLYALEGSRLGGAMLARQVAPGLPKAYLSAVHEKGGWVAFQQAMDAAAGDADWEQQAIAGAQAAFALFGDAALAQSEQVSAHG